MNPPASRRPVLSRPRAFALGLVVGVGLVVGWQAPSVRAQESQDVVAERELEYRSALNAYQSAQDARRAAERRFSRALQQIEDARATGADDRIEAAYARAQQQAVELQSLEQRVARTSERLEEVGSAFLEALDARLETLVAELSSTSSRTEQGELAALIRDLNNRVREVEQESELAQETRLVALPEVTFDARDGPVELQWKAELLERRASQYADRLDELEVEIEDLRRRQRRNRNLEDLLAGIGRFDDDQLPVVASSDRRDPEPGAMENDDAAGDDSTSVPQPERTLEERIESLELLRARIESYRDQVLLRARLFRQRAGEIS